MSEASAADWAGVIIGGVTAAVAIATAILAVISYRARTADQQRRAEVQAARDLFMAYDHLGSAPYDPDSKAEFEKLLLGAELLAPKSALVLRYRGLWFEQMLGDNRSAREKYLAALQVADEPGRLLLDLARVSDDPVEKVRYLTEATRTDRTAYQGHLGLARHYATQAGEPGADRDGLLAKAEEAALEAAQRGPNDSAVWSQLAWICSEKGEGERELEHRWRAVATADRSQTAGKLAELGYAQATVGPTPAVRQRGVEMILEAAGLVEGRDATPQWWLAAIAADAAQETGGQRAQALARVATGWAREALAIQPEDEGMRAVIEAMADILDSGDVPLGAAVATESDP